MAYSRRPLLPSSMFRVLSVLPVALCGVVALSAAQRSVDLTFQVQPGSTVTYGLQVPAGDSDFADVDYTGSINAVVVLTTRRLPLSRLTSARRAVSPSRIWI